MINLELIDKENKRKIAQAFLPLIENFYKNSKNKKAFQKWLKSKNS